MKKSINLTMFYFITNIVLYFLIFYSALVIDREQKNKIAETVTNVIRENVLMAQYRSASKDIEKLKVNNFTKIVLTNNKNEEIFRTSDLSNFFTLKIQKNIWSDSKKLFLKNKIIFYYEFTYLFWISLKILLGSIIVSLPLFFQIVRMIRKSQLQIIENEKIKIIAKHSRQLSHDIRSPLAALRFAIENEVTKNSNDFSILQKAIERINYITNAHLDESRHENIQLPINVNLKEIIHEIVNEKNIELNDIIFNVDVSNNIIVCVPNELKTIVSNIVNNSNDSMKGRLKKIIISSKNFGSNCELIIQDNGSGIPSNILNMIGVKEVTTKKEGNGLGLLNAVENLKKWGSSLNIEKSDMHGTIINIRFPVVKKLYVLIDNDELTKLTWAARAKKNDIEFYSFSTLNEFNAFSHQIPKDSEIYLDSDLGASELSGEQIAKILHELKFLNISMATGFSNSNFKSLTFLKSVISKAPPF